MESLTDAEFKAAEARGSAMLETEARATTAQYNRKTDYVTIYLVNGCTHVFPVYLIQDLSNASYDDLANIKVDGKGFNLHWPMLDVDLYVPALVAGVFGSHDWMNKRAGQTTSSNKDDKIL